MLRPRPHLSITLPKDFAFHANGAEAPKTPELKFSLSPPRSPQAQRPYRLKRRSRPAVTSFFTDGPSDLLSSNDTLMPSIEFTAAEPTSRPPLHSASLGVASGASAAQNAQRSPQTPEPQRRRSISSWMNTRDLSESISRPLSQCSILSDSSDDSAGSLISYPAGDGSCTSPESDAPAFGFPSVRKRKLFDRLDVWNKARDKDCAKLAKPTPIRWTPEMDRHLWSTYLLYLQDPTVTPFKMLPGLAPPLGVCHRVAREARKSWRAGKSRNLISPSFGRSFPVKGNNDRGRNSTGPDSPVTARALRSRNTTPTKRSSSYKPQRWPKSGSSTRRRLRYLCKMKPSIAPHYQRLLQSRSPSPLSPNTQPFSRSQSRLSEVSSPLGTSQTAFDTRDVQLSLTTSTADTMQPDGPLARLAGNQTSFLDHNADQFNGFNEPPVPFASEISIPSELNAEIDTISQLHSTRYPETPRLGSPFGFHTWGPSQSRQRLRPRAQRTPYSEVATIGRSLQSPLQFQTSSNRSSIQKRRARYPLEDEISPGGSHALENQSNDPFKVPDERYHRRVRSRGFSLGDLHQHPLQSLFNVPSQGNDASTLKYSTESTGQTYRSSGFVEPRTPVSDQTRTLDSPFNGISPRPTRKSMRHLASISLGAQDSSVYNSIGQTLDESTDLGDAVGL